MARGQAWQGPAPDPRSLESAGRPDAQALVAIAVAAEGQVIAWASSFLLSGPLEPRQAEVQYEQEGKDRRRVSTLLVGGQMTVVIRPANPNDCRFMFNLSQDPSVRAMSTRDAAFEYSDHERWYADKLSNGHNRIWIIEADGIPAGQVRYGSCFPRNEAEVAISVSPMFRGKGLAKDLLLTTEPWALSWLKVTKLVALVLTTNVVSQALFESCGYRMTGWVERMKKQHRRYEK